MDDFNNIERLRPRSFTGLRDNEWDEFTKIIHDGVGYGKRSFYLTRVVKRTIENGRWSIERRAEVDQRATHAVNDACKDVGLQDMVKPYDNNAA